jgi:hypothetical protein
VQVWSKVLSVVGRQGSAWEENMEALYKHFDQDGNGSIDLDELAKGLSWLGCRLSPSQVKHFQADVDADESGDLTIEEFMVTPRLVLFYHFVAKSLINHARIFFVLPGCLQRLRFEFVFKPKKLKEALLRLSCLLN